jgi:hypothetical protein
VADVLCIVVADPAIMDLEVKGGVEKSNRLYSVEGVEDDIYSEFGIVLGKEAFVPEIVVPFTSIVFIAVENADAAIDGNCLQVVVHEIIAPTVELESGVGRTFLKMKERTVHRVVVGYLL